MNEVISGASVNRLQCLASRQPSIAPDIFGQRSRVPRLHHRGEIILRVSVLEDPTLNEINKKDFEAVTGAYWSAPY